MYPHLSLQAEIEVTGNELGVTNQRLQTGQHADVALMIGAALHIIALLYYAAVYDLILKKIYKPVSVFTIFAEDSVFPPAV